MSARLTPARLTQERLITMALMPDIYFPTNENRMKYIREVVRPQLPRANWYEIRRHIQKNLAKRENSWRNRSKKIGRNDLNESRLRAVLQHLATQSKQNVNVNAIRTNSRPQKQNHLLPKNKRKTFSRTKPFVRSNISRNR